MATSSRARSGRGEGERLRVALLDAAAELLDELRDAERLSIRAVTRRAGVSPMALYLHFSDKNELIKALKIRCLDALGAELTQAEKPHEGDPVAQVCAMGRAYLRYARTHPGQYALLFHTDRPFQKGPGGEADARVRATGLKVFGFLADATARCPAADGADPTELATLIWMALHGRASIQPAMPWFPFTGEDAYVTLIVEHFVTKR